MHIHSVKLKYDITEIACVALFFVRFMVHSSGNSMILMFFQIVLSGYLWWFCLTHRRYTRKQLQILLILSACIALFSLMRFGKSQVVVTYVPMAVYLIGKKNVSKTLWYTLALFISARTMYAWVTSVNSYTIFPGVSRNYVSVFLLLALTAINLYYEKKQQDCPTPLVVLVWLCSVLAVGRGGILASTVVFAFFAFYKLFKKSNRRRRYAKIVLGLVVITGVALLAYFNAEYIQREYLGRFFGYETSADVSTSLRIQMLQNYVGSCFRSFTNFIFGADPTLYSATGSNMHNSYIQVHSTFGLPGLLFVTVGSIRALIFLYKHKLYSSLIIFSGILVRAATDWCFPAFPLDVFLLYYLLLPSLNTEALGHHQLSNRTRPVSNRARPVVSGKHGRNIQ